MPKLAGDPPPWMKTDPLIGVKEHVHWDGVPVYRVRVYDPVAKTQREVKVAGLNAARARRAELADRRTTYPRRPLVPDNIRVRDAIAQHLEAWKFKGRAKVPRPLSSVKTRTAMLKTYFEEPFEDWWLHEVDTPDLDQFLAEFDLVSGGMPSANTVDTMATAIRGLFKWARRERLVAVNPALEMSVELDGYTQTKVVDVSLWRAEYQASLMDGLAPAFGFGDIARALTYTALRWEELVAIPLDDDHVRTTGDTWALKVAWTASESGGRRDIRADTKTAAGHRIVTVPSICQPVIASMIERAREGQARKPGEYQRLVNGVRGGYLSYSSWTKYLKAAREKSTEGKLYSAHDFRHVAASLLITAGWDDFHVARQLGHSKVETVKNLYGHLFNEDRDNLRRLLDQRISGLLVSGTRLDLAA